MAKQGVGGCKTCSSSPNIVIWSLLLSSSSLRPSRASQRRRCCCCCCRPGFASLASLVSQPASSSSSWTLYNSAHTHRGLGGCASLLGFLGTHQLTAAVTSCKDPNRPSLPLPVRTPPPTPLPPARRLLAAHPTPSRRRMPGWCWRMALCGTAPPLVQRAQRWGRSCSTHPSQVGGRVGGCSVSHPSHIWGHP